MSSYMSVPATYLRQSTTASLAAVGLGLLATVAVPFAPITTLVASLAALVVADRALRAAERRRHERLEQVKPRWFRMDPSQIPMSPDLIYLGEGYSWGQDERALYDRTLAREPKLPVREYESELRDLGLWPTSLPPGRNEEDVARHNAKAEGGDPRILGMGWRSSGSVYLPRKLLAQHLGCWGATGSGKTRGIEGITAWVAANGHALLVIDPKGDPPLTSLCWNLAERYNRGFTWVSLSNPEQSATYNALLSYDDPAEMFSRVKTLIPTSKEKFWEDTPAAAAGGALVLKGWNRNLAKILGSVDARLAPVHVAFGRAMAIASERGDTVPTVADVEKGWSFARENEIPPVGERDESGTYRMTVRGLAPMLSTLYRDAVDEPNVVVAIASKLIHPESWIGLDPDKIKRIEEERSAAAKKNDPKAGPFKFDLGVMIQEAIPLEDGWAGEPWLAALWAPLADKKDAILAALSEIRMNAVGTVLPWCATADEERKKYCSSLATALGGFVGRWRIVSSPESDLDLQRVVDNGEIAYVSLNTLALKASAEAFAGILIADLASLAGRANASGKAKPREIFIIFDELASLVSSDLIRLLQQARSAGVRILTLAQNRPALIQRLGDEGQMKDMLGNQVVMVQFRAGSKDEASEAANAYCEVQIERTSDNVGVSPALGGAGHGDVSIMSNNLGKTTSAHDTTLIPPGLLLDLPQGCAVVGIDRIPYIVQFPQIACDGGKDWYEQIHAPLPAWYLEKLTETGKEIPAWHHRAVERQAADPDARAIAEIEAAAKKAA